MALSVSRLNTLRLAGSRGARSAANATEFFGVCPIALRLPQVGNRRTRSTATATEFIGGCPFAHTGSKTETVGRQSVPNKAAEKMMSFEDIPSPKALPLLGITKEMLASGAAKIHEYCDLRHKELGPIFRDKLGTVDTVVISDTNSIQKTYLNEGKYPVHMVPEAWTIYNEKSGTKRGLFFMEGEEWFRRRELLNKVLFCPKSVSSNGPAFNGVITDLLRGWEFLSTDNASGVIPDLEHELYNWSIECLGAMVFGRRLGCVPTKEEPNSEMPQKFVQVVQQIFYESARMAMIPPRLAYILNLPVWKRFSEAATGALDIARTYVEKRMAEIEEMQANNIKVNGVLTKLMADKDIQKEEIVQIVADLVIAAADTTSHAVQWALHSLAVNPDCQEKFLREIEAAAPNGELIEEKHLQKIPYSMWLIKETMRMYPIAPFLTRILPKDVILRDYHIPKGKMIVMSQYTVGRDPERFPDPNRFFPERWKQPDDRLQRTGNQGCIPFGTGSRSCIGRRVAELQMRLMLTRTVQKFKLESSNDAEVGIVLRMITTPDAPIRLKLQKR